ncbi:MAG TPA: RNA polymerase sigma factor [Gammaproteobacteria bacterium]|nr:RNA polymerase sigma factor [Gammaproteobacteria bacterium]
MDGLDAPLLTDARYTSVAAEPTSAIAEPASVVTHGSVGAFLASVEGRAFRMAQLTTGRREESLDLVQEAMLRLAERYAERPPGEWPAIFFRILANACRDWHRRRRVREQVLVWFGGKGRATPEEPCDDWIEGVADGSGPLERLQGTRSLAVLVRALRALPMRQQQCFWLRNVEGLDVSTTARALGISDGSVKTHYARAVQRLRAELEGHWP